MSYWEEKLNNGSFTKNLLIHYVINDIILNPSSTEDAINLQSKIDKAYEDDGISQTDSSSNNSSNSSSEESTSVEYKTIGTSFLAADGLTVTLNSMTVTEKTGSYTYAIDYKLENKNSTGSIDEGTFKMFYKDTTNGLPQYGFFGKLFPSDSKNRTYTLRDNK